ncbi:ribonuclease MRP complex subunit [Schizosaccharomyces cryophilus OY26]|uniref:Ribonuclease MRP complex subunit n=1 Tax=Schizosaccharomyces cryophilus (strain OY26 / ATCC MYA-4695 / CBS 11777 / NBRC 106824 / NRRL Y48691) TaxID=653667 RepID=S9XCD7_SCHCR|nr:ribonuclease MRP complex subunit [Schizosaccharomyces cryophilus OY26]EPY51511.1 ribonuclease MRP complex subunit [Schizosaccharomyces cryophilus OY26]
MDVLQPDAVLLQKIVYRNKNQHRLTIWWRHVMMLHRRLKQWLSGNETAKSLLLQQCPKSYALFTNVIAHGQYPGLGCLLLGILSRVWYILGGMEYEASLSFPSPILSPNLSLQEQAIKDTEKAASDLGVVISREQLSSSTPQSSFTQRTDLTSSPSPDMKSIRTPQLPSAEAQSIGGGVQATDIPPLRSLESPSAAPKKKKKKSKKKKDEIDDIFGL